MIINVNGNSNVNNCLTFPFYIVSDKNLWSVLKSKTVGSNCFQIIF